jgi:hypothetical protein
VKLTIDIRDRRQQLYFFLGYAAYGNSQELGESLSWYITHGYDVFDEENVFLIYPYNASFDKVLRSYHIVINSKKKWLGDRMVNLIEEFIFLASDFEPPCCGDGRTFYWGNSKSIFLVCDRCSQMYDLEGSEIESVDCRELTKKDFLALLPGDTENLWPYHKDLYTLMQMKG